LYQSHQARKTPCGPKQPSLLSTTETKTKPVSIQQVATVIDTKQSNNDEHSSANDTTINNGTDTTTTITTTTTCTSHLVEVNPILSKELPSIIINTCREETVHAMYETINQLQTLIQRPLLDPVAQTQLQWMVVQRFAKVYADMIRSLRIKTTVENTLQRIAGMPEEEYMAHVRAIAHQINSQLPCASSPSHSPSHSHSHSHSHSQ
jgi:hypothetical protein